MSTPKIAGKLPVVLDLEAGTYYWCACGRSAKQPFCDGSHEGTEFSPKEFILEESKKVALCLCKHTGDAPFCDGTHKEI
ncbi:MAG: CDGSH iron-sulfur domain-containing protein [Chlorobi bacterium]|nr:CDGSH iron-sulfur domain-containing protein [Chlorobiota bacterium]